MDVEKITLFWYLQEILDSPENPKSVLVLSYLGIRIIFLQKNRPDFFYESDYWKNQVYTCEGFCSWKYFLLSFSHQNLDTSQTTGLANTVDSSS